VRASLLALKTLCNSYSIVEETTSWKLVELFCILGQPLFKGSLKINVVRASLLALKTLCNSYSIVEETTSWKLVELFCILGQHLPTYKSL